MTDTSLARQRFQWLSNLPVWLRLVLAFALIALGVVLLFRPTSSLGVLALFLGAGLVIGGIVDALQDAATRARSGRVLRVLDWLIPILWIVAGVFVLVFPGLTVRLVGLIVGIALVASGMHKIVLTFERGATPDLRIANGAFGLASVVFGVLALAWPDITLLIVAVVFGARLIIAGASFAWAAIRPRQASSESERHAPGLLRRWSRSMVAVATLVLAIVGASLSVAISGTSAVVDDFYAAPRDVPTEPGQLIRSEPSNRATPEGSSAWRILYTTTRGDGTPAVASGLVVVPEGDGPWPVIDWNHGTTGYAEECAPSLLVNPFEAGALFLLPEIISEGWAVVATDYIGLGTEGPHPYLIGADSAHASLDAVRAAQQLSDAQLSTETVVWGHSQGGGAALWTGALADTYAPELDIQGVAALAPASNIPGLLENLPNVTGGSVFASFAFAAYASIYDDVHWRDYIRPGAEATVRAMSERCLSGAGVLVSVLDAVALSKDPEIFSTDPTTGAFGERAIQNIPPATISAPLLLAQGGDDSLVTPESQASYVEQVCGAGQQVDYRVYAGRDHVPLVEPDSPLVPDLFDWTAARFQGEAVEPGCTTRSE